MKSGNPRKHKRYRRPAFRRLASVEGGTSSIPADPSAHPTEVRVIGYGPDDIYEQQISDVASISALREKHQVVWVDVTGVANVELIRSIGTMFQLHLLSIEDSIHVHQRAKTESYDDYEFLVARMAPMAREETTDQLSLFLGRNFVVTIQERPGDDLGPVRERLRNRQGRIRNGGPDYLAYSILDALIDAYFPLVENYGVELEQLEDDITFESNADLLARLYQVRRKLLYIRRAVWPLREAIHALLRDDSEMITDGTKVYLRDCLDHTVQIIDILETYRELSSSLMEVYLSSISNRMNEIMKILTIITTIFIPISFIASVYGMNFHTEKSPYNMPELSWYLGYPLCIAIMLVLTVAQLYLYYRKGWIGKSGGRSERSDN